MNVKQVSLIFLALMSGMVPDIVFAAEDDKQTVKLVVEAFSDSTDAKGMHYVINNYLSEACAKPKKGFRLLQKRYAKGQHEFRGILLDPGEEFLFQVEYTEELRMQTRACSYLAGFTPQAGRSYRAVYTVSDQVSRCTIELFDVTDVKDQPEEKKAAGSTAATVSVEPSAETLNQPVKVSYQPPEFSCEKPKSKGNKNGVPTHTFKERIKY